jgi:ABC-type iron transport system FetAB ATPase subunit
MVLPSSPAATLKVRQLRNSVAGPFDFELAAGECIAICGPSGAGKSVLLRMIADLDPHDGEVCLNGQPCADVEGPAWRRQVVYCAAEPGWWADAVNEHFPTEQWPAARHLLPALGLAPALFDAPLQRLSTGERQRLALLRALLRNPPVLLLDEPTGALDAASTALVEQELARRLADGLMLVLVTHDAQQAARLATRRFELQQGCLHAL